MKFITESNYTNINKLLNKNYTSCNEAKDAYNSPLDLLNELFDLFVPEVGRAETIAGEIIRAISRINYVYYDSCHIVGYGSGVDSAASSLGYLKSTVSDIDNYCDDLINCEFCDYSYDTLLCNITEYIANYLLNHSDLFNTTNTDNSRDDKFISNLYNDTDSRRNWYGDDSDDYDDYDDVFDDYYDED